MGADRQPVYAFSWAQIAVEGMRNAPRDMLEIGASLRWGGTALRLDGPQGLLPLGTALDADRRREGAARAVRRWLGAGRTGRPPSSDYDDVPAGSGFTMTDGRRLWAVTLIEGTVTRPPLAVLCGAPPPSHCDLWVVDCNLGASAPSPVADAVVCFAPGTLILCDDGPRPVEQVTAGMRIQTHDNGYQEVLWAASRRIGGARLCVEPALAPVRLRGPALGFGGADRALVVSPDHMVLLRGSRVRAAFGCDEVLASARDLVDGRGVHVVRGLTEIRYHHLLLPRHEVIFANGIAAESLCPDIAMPDSLGPQSATRPPQHACNRRPGRHARRLLSPSEAAIVASGCVALQSRPMTMAAETMAERRVFGHLT